MPSVTVAARRTRLVAIRAGSGTLNSTSRPAETGRDMPQESQWTRPGAAVRPWAIAASIAVAAVVHTRFGLGPAVAGRPIELDWWVMALGFLVAELMVLHLPIRGRPRDLPVGDVPLVVGLALASPVGLVLGRVIGTALALLTTRAEAATAGFRIAVHYLGTVVAVAVYGIALGDAAPIDPRGWGAAILAVLAIHLVDTLLYAAEPVPSDRRVPRVLAGVLQSLAIALIGVVTVIVLWTDPFSVTVVVSLTGLGYLALRFHALLGRRYRDLHALFTFMGTLGGGSNDEPLNSVLGGVRRHMDATTSALLVGGDDELPELVVDHRGDIENVLIDPGIAVRIAASAVCGEAVHLDPALRTELERVIGLELHDGLLAIVSDSGRPRCVLIAAGRIGGQPFDRYSRQFFAALTRHAETTLDRSRLIERLRTEISEREYQATHDALTGLPNRQAFLDATDRLLAEPGDDVIAVLTLDLNRFKDVNDTLGHDEGDRLIRDVGDRIRHAVRPTDTVARLGGDEFAILLPVGSPPDAVAVARRIEASLRSPFRRAGIDVEMTASIGIAVASSGGERALTLLQRADIAMFAAKTSDTAFEVYAPELDDFSPRRLMLAGELRAGIAACEIRCHYQPKISVVDGSVVGVEALARWTSATHGEVPPAEFIPVAEKTGLIRPLTYAVLQEALAASARLRDAGLHIPIAVNISPRNLADPDFVSTVDDIIKAAGTEPQSITFEITEDSLLHDSSRAAGVLELIATLGITISIDDFGTGYSSLGYLQRLPVTELKIDRSFVMRMDLDEADRAIVDSTIDLAHRLGLTVVAEGVETASTLEFLAEAGCDIAQGFHIARPMPEPKLRTWLDAHKAEPGVATVTHLRAAAARTAGRQSPAPPS
jgi:diguanylate cyclase (GGDEF)-like protein